MIASAQPYVPASDSTVLAQVPTALLQDSTLRALRTEHRNDPANLDVAARLGWRYVALARRTGAQRYLGYAEAALTAWTESDAPPPEMLMLRASIAQSRHEFDRALEDLRRILLHNPRNAGAWLMLSTIQKVTGRPLAALQSCEPLRRMSTPLLHAACRANASSMTAGAARAYDNLDAIALASDAATAGERQWALWVLASLASDLNMRDEADRHYAHALTAGTPDLNLIIACADHMLDTGRPQAALELLEGLERTAPAALRRAIAFKRLGEPAVAAMRDWLQTHFADLRLRGDSGQAGDEARFELHVLERPQAALDLARNNFEIHRESRDIRLLLDAGLASRRPNALVKARDWLKDVGYAGPMIDVRLKALDAMNRERNT